MKNAARGALIGLVVGFVASALGGLLGMRRRRTRDGERRHRLSAATHL